jgi:hypothetical protein
MTVIYARYGFSKTKAGKEDSEPDEYTLSSRNLKLAMLLLSTMELRSTKATLCWTKMTRTGAGATSGAASNADSEAAAADAAAPDAAAAAAKSAQA